MSLEDNIRELLTWIGEDPTREGLKETPQRFLKAFEFATSGYNQDPRDILKTFEDGAEDYDELITVCNIPVYSLCLHHILPMFGVAHVGYIPDGKIVGLSKIPRLVECFARRLQVQEALTSQIATCLQETLNPKGVAVVLQLRHLCMESRGVRARGTITHSSSLKGCLLGDSSAKMEFLKLIELSRNV